MLKNASDHYLGEKGKVYFELYEQGSKDAGWLNARKFAPWIQLNDVVLDFGCGNGGILANLNCKTRYGIEINPYAREVANKRGFDVYEDLTNISDHSITKVISNHALEHVKNPLQTLIDLRKKLTDDGMLILCLPFDDWRIRNISANNDINHHLFTWSPLLLRNLLTEAGYDTDKVWVYSHAWHSLMFRFNLHKFLPIFLFDFICSLTAWLLNRHQVMAIAKKQSIKAIPSPITGLEPAGKAGE